MTDIAAGAAERSGKAGAAAADEGGFDAHFNRHILPHLSALEEKRRAIVSAIDQRLILGWAGVAAGLAIAIYAASSSGEMWPFLHALAIGFGSLAWAHAPSMRYVRLYKDSLLPVIASYFGNLSYESKGGIDLSRLRQSAFLPRHDGYEHEDLFTGTYRDAGVAFCEARLTKVGGKEKKRRKTLLGGVFILLSMNKKFNGRTIIHDRKRMKSWLRNRLESRLEPVDLEDPEFERHFDVYSDDQVEARYLLTPAFMTRLLDLSRTVGQGELEAVFFDSQLLIVLPAASSGGGLTMEMFGKRIGGGKSNLFEPPMLKTSVHDSGEVRRIAREIRSILSIVDALKLHEKTRL